MSLFKIDINNENSLIIFTVFGKQFKLKSKKLMLKNAEIYLKKQDKLFDEFYYANLWKDATNSSEWLKDKSVTPTKGAANYSFLFLLYKVLEELEPQTILEFGLGQSSKITSQYINNFCNDGKLDIVEHNKEWIEYFKLNTNKNVKIHQRDIIKSVLNGEPSDKYDDLSEIIQTKKYDLIIIDGPYGYNRKYPRTNILDIIPKNLSEHFAIILDDYERDGERNTANLIFEKLNKNNINYITSIQKGLKHQILITDSEQKFIHRI